MGIVPRRPHQRRQTQGGITGSVPRRGAVVYAALAGFFVLAAPLERAVADRPSTPVTVTNPQVPVRANSLVSTTVVNQSTSPALTSSVDDPGRVA